MTNGALLLMKGAEIDCCGQLATEEGPRNGRKLTQKVSLRCNRRLSLLVRTSLNPTWRATSPAEHSRWPASPDLRTKHRAHLPAPEQRQKTHGSVPTGGSSYWPGHTKSYLAATSAADLNLQIRNSAIYQMCSRPREWQWPSQGSSSPSSLLHTYVHF